MRSKCEVIFKESDFKLATIRSAKTQYEISTLSLIRIRDFMLKDLKIEFQPHFHQLIQYQLLLNDL
jgi:hypothetical protein